MKELLHDVKRLTREELKRANGEFPLFASDHEGYAVMLEEFEETLSELLHSAHLLEELKIKIFSDCSDESKGATVKELRKATTHLGAEAIQLGAMVEKFTMSKIKRMVGDK